MRKETDINSAGRQDEILRRQQQPRSGEEGKSSRCAALFEVLICVLMIVACIVGYVMIPPLPG